MIKTDFKYTNNWFDRNINISMKLLKTKFQDKKIDILEIGSHEGKSTIWMLDNLCTHESSLLTCIDPYPTSDQTSPVTNQTYDNFQHNISLCENRSKLQHYKKYSQDILPKLISDNQKFDIIYIDGSHLVPDVTFDLEHSHKLLKPNGVILLDDVGFKDREDHIMGVIKKFLKENKNNYKIVLKEYQWMLEHIPTSDTFSSEQFVFS